MLEVMDSAEDNLYPALFQCFTIIICGYVAGRLNIVSPVETKGISTFVGNFALPSLIFLSLAKLDFSTVNWSFLLAILIAKGTVFFTVIIVTLLVTRPMALGKAAMYAIFCTQSNDFALGYPIISAIYGKSHPEYALLLYLMAPISLAILNPFAFVLMEVNKQRELQVNPIITIEGQRKTEFLKLTKQIMKGIAFNPVLVMTVLGILGNIIFKHNLSIYIEGLLQTFGNSFSAAALFLLGLRMVGQIYRLRGPALVLPFVLIMVKLIVLPVVMKQSVSMLNSGGNDTETQSLSTYAFLYGTIPTAPAVFVFSNMYQLEIDLVASTMVICTFLSGPIMFISAKMISLNKDYQDQLKIFGFDLSIIALALALWVLLVFIVTKKYKRMPHRLTICLLLSQILLSVAVILGGPHPVYRPIWQENLRQALLTFSMYSCILWTSMLSVGLILLQSRGPCFVVTLWPVLGFVAWGAPSVMVSILLLNKGAIAAESTAKDAIRLCLLVFCITVTTGSLIVYMRFRRGRAISPRFTSNSGSSPLNESTSLVDNAEGVSNTQSISNNGCYGTITATPSPNKPNSKDAGENGLSPASGADIEDMNVNNAECRCDPNCEVPHTCQYLNELDRAASDLGLLPPEQSRGRGGQLMKHTVLIIVYSLAMFIGITYTSFRMMIKDESGVFIEIEFLDIAANYGQALMMFILFGLDPQEMVIPAIRFFKNRWHGADTVVLPDIDDLSFETKHVCDQFITHHLQRCKEAIAKDTRWRMRTYRDVFRGACLVRWLIDCGLAKDEHEAITYGRHLLDGRLISHVNNAHHFSNSPLLYTFK